MFKRSLKGILLTVALLASVTLASCEFIPEGEISGGGTEANGAGNDEKGTHSNTAPCPHDEIEWVVDLEPSCSSEGERHKVCLDCGKTVKVESVATVAHELPPESEWKVVYESDYGTGGLMTAECTACGAEMEINEEMLQFSEGLVYTANEDGSCFVSGIGSCKDTYLYIPVTSPDGKKVTSIGDGAFAGCKDIEAVYMAGTVVKIGDYAFDGCTSLRSVEIREEVETIGNGAFAGCTSLEQIEIEEGNETFAVNSSFFVDVAGKRIIAYIGGASNPVIPDGMTSVGAGAFENKNIVSVTVPISVIEIGDGAFEGCEGLTTVNYRGTSAQWKAVSKGDVNYAIFEANVICTDGAAPESVRWYGRSTISGNALYVYDAIVSAVMNDTPKEKIELDESLKITLDDYHAAQMMFVSDYPECFWWDGRAKYYQNKDEHIVSIEPEYTYEGDVLVSMRTQLDAVVDAIIAAMPNGSVFEKALYLHDAVAARVEYVTTPNDQNPYGALVEGRAVCNGYATAYQLLLQEAGIRAWTVNGSAGGEAHAWNVVWMDGTSCVYTDVTWDDQGDDVYHYYFNMSLDEIDDDHVASEGFDLPECGHSSWGCVDVDPNCNVIGDDSTAYTLAGFFGEPQNGMREARFFFVGEDFEKWFNGNSVSLYSLLGCSGFSMSSHGNEYILIAKGIQ